MALVLEINEVEDFLLMGRREEPIHGNKVDFVRPQWETITGEALALLLRFEIRPLSFWRAIRSECSVDNLVKRDLKIISNKNQLVEARTLRRPSLYSPIPKATIMLYTVKREALAFCDLLDPLN